MGDGGAGAAPPAQPSPGIVLSMASLTLREGGARSLPSPGYPPRPGSLVFCPALGLPPIWEHGRSRLPLSWALGSRSRAQMKGAPRSGDSRDSIILAGQPAAPSWGPGSTEVAVLRLHGRPAPCHHPPTISTARAFSPSIPSTSTLVPKAACPPGVLGWGQLRRVGGRPLKQSPHSP